MIKPLQPFGLQYTYSVVIVQYRISDRVGDFRVSVIPHCVLTFCGVRTLWTLFMLKQTFGAASRSNWRNGAIIVPQSFAIGPNIIELLAPILVPQSDGVSPDSL